ncbi:4a-hydroxytetrahydrobiopterin dehydratase [Pelagibius sp. Alg239-R121]|uniref:4a-hydroxytetrahydrobiopterin dehydratase n=1 Tax=Pelagibius sp. Alg239-R121 TaxID=2993448 RepID=UPI0024A7563B|nr:4a-hydroxytetrahydrobiopterin dehydratase [Pelagibius sp. Alg239-R121]
MSMDNQLPKDLAAAGWQEEAGGKAIVKTYQCDSFPAAMSFMLQVSFTAERLDHHPEWSNVYDRVVVCLTTHDAGGVTEKDFALARAMEQVMSSRRIAA